MALGDSPDATSLSIRVRAIDTGGNSTLSDPISIGLVPDTFPPTVVRVDPADGDALGQGSKTVRVRFSEPIEPIDVSDGAFEIFEAGPNGTPGDADDIQVPIRSLLLRDDDTLVQLETDPLAVGSFEIRLQRAAISDANGNAMGTGTFTSRFEIVEFVPVTITFDNATGSPPSYTESGLTVTSGQDHIHLDTGALSNHSSCCSTPYTFKLADDAHFSVLSFQVVGGSGIGSGTFASSSGGLITPSAVGTVTLSGAAWTNITSFTWDQPVGDMSIDNLVISVVPTRARTHRQARRRGQSGPRAARRAQVGSGGERRTAPRRGRGTP